MSRKTVSDKSRVRSEGEGLNTSAKKDVRGGKHNTVIPGVIEGGYELFGGCYACLQSINSQNTINNKQY